MKQTWPLLPEDVSVSAGQGALKHPWNRVMQLQGAVKDKFRELRRQIRGNLAKIGRLRKTSWIKRDLRSKALVGIEYLLLSGARRSYLQGGGRVLGM